MAMLIVCYEAAIAISTEPKNQIPYEFITMIPAWLVTISRNTVDNGDEKQRAN
ncbi:hypothetical protein [Nitrosomonas sp.]|uniref:hypothetical protein n=1 Tax=Nitrosomonas sp. TaxID=42353 RepID=UPI00284FBD42|nr:hypothetical protein [Nitrosomonas sp.]MDR4515040.1 hypothetical protein [Nitrosomonas sp.]